MIGPNLLVVNVFDPGSTGVQVYLPGKSEVWYDLRSNQKYHGGQHLNYSVTPDTFAAFVRGGSVLPWANGDCLELRIYPAATDQPIKTQVFDDDGIHFPFDPKKGATLNIEINVSSSPGQVGLQCKIKASGLGRASFKELALKAMDGRKCADEKGLDRMPWPSAEIKVK
jgi:alpha-glucosidase (family GH31 glycosyl hydrolase)